MVEDQRRVTLGLPAPHIPDGHHGHDERRPDGPSERQPGQQRLEARRRLVPHADAPGPAQRLEAHAGRRRRVEPTLQAPAVDTDGHTLRVEPELHGQQTAGYEGHQNALAIRSVSERGRLEEVDAGTAPERADVAGGDGRQRRAGAEGGGESRRVGDVHAGPQVGLRPAGEGGDQMAANPLHPHGVEEPDAPRGGVRQLGEAGLLRAGLVGQGAPEGDDRPPDPSEETLGSNPRHLRAALGGRAAVPMDGSARDEITRDAQQRHDREERPTAQPHEA